MKKGFSKRITISFIGLLAMIGLLAVPAVADENASIETDTAKLSFAGTRMLDPSVPSGDSVGKDYVLVIYNYENYTTDPKSPQSDFWPRVYQNGVELDTLGTRSVNDTEDSKLLDSFYKTAIKGGTLVFGQAYEIQDNSPLTIILKENGLSTVDPVSLEVNIGEEASATEESSAAESSAAEDDSNEVTAETTDTASLTPNFVFHTEVSSALEGDAKYETLTVGSSGDGVVKLKTCLFTYIYNNVSTDFRTVHRIRQNLRPLLNRNLPRNLVFRIPIISLKDTDKSLSYPFFRRIFQDLTRKAINNISVLIKNDFIVFQKKYPLTS